MEKTGIADEIQPEEMMNYCTYCGARLPKEGLYCPECGKRIPDRIKVEEDGKGGLVFDVPEGSTVTVSDPE